MRRKKKEEEEEKRDGVEKGQLHFSKREGKKKRRSSSSSIERELPIKSKLQPFSFFENVVSLRPSLRHGRLQRLWRYPDDEAEGRASQGEIRGVLLRGSEWGELFFFFFFLLSLVPPSPPPILPPSSALRSLQSAHSDRTLPQPPCLQENEPRKRGNWAYEDRGKSVSFFFFFLLANRHRQHRFFFAPPPSPFSTPTSSVPSKKNNNQLILGLLTLFLLLAAALSVAALALGSSKGITTYGGRTVSISVAGSDIGTLGEGTPPVAVGYAKYGDPSDSSTLLPLGELSPQVRALGVAFAALLGCGAAAALVLVLVTLLKGTGGLPAALLGFPIGLAVLGVTVALYAAATTKLAGGSAPVQRSVGDLFKATVDAIRAPGAAFGVAVGAALAWLAAAVTAIGLPPRSQNRGGDLSAF